MSLETTEELPERRTVPRESAPVLTAFPRSNDVTVSRGETPPEHALIEIPAEILDVLAQSPVSARTWRLAVRDYFQWASAHGYVVTGVRRDSTADRSFYVLERERPAAATLPATRELQRAR